MLEKEAFEILDEIEAVNTQVHEAQWFLDLMRGAYSDAALNSQKPRLFVLGEDIPQDLVLAMDPKAHFMVSLKT